MSTDEPTEWPEFGQGAGDFVFSSAPTTDSAPDEGFPRTYRPAIGAGVRQQQVFDPALKQYDAAFRAGEPEFAVPGRAERWHAARRRAVDHMLAAVAGSPWAEHLILRGSILLKAWYGPAAREPGDLDFVVTPTTWEMAEPRTDRMFETLARDAEARSRAGGDVRIEAAGAVSDEIWTYDRVPGRRLVLPWHAAGLPSGTVQLDFVFNETLPVGPEFTDVPRRDGTGAHRILAATAELSLAWKIMWLLSDAYPQGKDLYDAVLLAEATPLRPELLHTTLAVGETRWAGQRITAEVVLGCDPDWDEFTKEYPGVVGTPEDLLRRLTAALEPVFAAEVGPPVDGCAWRLRWLAPLVEAHRGVAAREGLRAVAQGLTVESIGLAEALVIMREVLGPDDCSLADAGEVYVNHLPRTSPERAYFTRNPERIDQALAELARPV